MKKWISVLLSIAMLVSIFATAVVPAAADAAKTEITRVLLEDEDMERVAVGKTVAGAGFGGWLYSGDDQLSEAGSWSAAEWDVLDGSTYKDCTDDETFAADKTYAFDILFGYPADSHILADDVKYELQIGSDSYTGTAAYDSPGGNYINYKLRFEGITVSQAAPAEPAEIDSITGQTQFSAPVFGASVAQQSDFVFAFLDGEEEIAVTIEDVRWMYEYIWTNPSHGDEVIEWQEWNKSTFGGEKYQLWVDFTLRKGDSLADEDEVTASVTFGELATSTLRTAGGTIYEAEVWMLNETHGRMRVDFEKVEAPVIDKIVVRGDLPKVGDSADVADWENANALSFEYYSDDVKISYSLSNFFNILENDEASTDPKDYDYIGTSALAEDMAYFFIFNSYGGPDFADDCEFIWTDGTTEVTGQFVEWYTDGRKDNIVYGFFFNFGAPEPIVIDEIRVTGPAIEVGAAVS